MKYLLYVSLMVLAYPTLAVLGEHIPLPGPMTPHNTYRLAVLPDFDTNQDFSAKDYYPVVRLELADGTFMCSGSVISNEYVLTAAHCLMHWDRFMPGMDREIRIVARAVRPGAPDLVLTAKPAALSNRADYGLILGNFGNVTKVRIHTDTNLGEVLSGVAALCGYPWGAQMTCYVTAAPFDKYYDHMITKGVLFPGMSGGPVVDGGSNLVWAVNSAVIGDMAIVAPLLGMFETFGIHVK